MSSVNLTSWLQKAKAMGILQDEHPIIANNKVVSKNKGNLKEENPMKVFDEVLGREETMHRRVTPEVETEIVLAEIEPQISMDEAMAMIAEKEREADE